MGHICLTWPNAGGLGGTPSVCRKRKIRQSHLSPQDLCTPGAWVGGSCWHQSLNLPPQLTHSQPSFQSMFYQSQTAPGLLPAGPVPDLSRCPSVPPLGAPSVPDCCPPLRPAQCCW